MMESTTTTNALIQFFESELKLFSLILKKINRKRELKLYSIFSEGIEGLNYLISAMQKEKYSWGKSSTKFCKAIIAIGNAEFVLKEKRAYYNPCKIDGAKVYSICEQSALIQFLNDLMETVTLIIGQVDQDEEPICYMQLDDIKKAINQLIGACQVQGFAKISRLRYINSICNVCSIANDIVYYNRIADINKCINKVFENSH